MFSLSNNPSVCIFCLFIENIWQHEIYCDDGDSIPKFVCTLCDHGQRVYLGLDERKNVVASVSLFDVIKG